MAQDIFVLLEVGVGHERNKNWTAAAETYRKAVVTETSDLNGRYFSNNNLGYVLVQLGQFEEAEKYCRVAVSIIPDQYNAYKNLGLAFQGQGHWEAAVRCFLEATRLSPGNARAWQHLEHLLKARPRVMKENPELASLIGQARKSLAANGYIQPPLNPSPMFQLETISTEH